LLDAEMIEQREHVLSVLLHRVRDHVVRLIGLAVAEHVRRDHAMAEARQRGREPRVHPAVHQEAVGHHDRAFAGAVLAIGDTSTAMREARDHAPS